MVVVEWPTSFTLDNRLLVRFPAIELTMTILVPVACVVSVVRHLVVLVALAIGLRPVTVRMVAHLLCVVVRALAVTALVLLWFGLCRRARGLIRLGRVSSLLVLTCLVLAMLDGVMKRLPDMFRLVDALLVSRVFATSRLSTWSPSLVGGRVCLRVLRCWWRFV